jgi:hypothetical protein
VIGASSLVWAGVLTLVIPVAIYTVAVILAWRTARTLP